MSELAQKILESIKKIGSAYEQSDSYRRYRETMVDFDVNSFEWLLREFSMLMRCNPGNIFEMEAAIQDPPQDLKKAFSFMIELFIKADARTEVQLALEELILNTKSSIEKQQT